MEVGVRPTPRLALFSQTRTRRLESRYGNARNSTALTTLAHASAHPMPIARLTMPTAVRIGRLRSWRRVCARFSRMTDVLDGGMSGVMCDDPGRGAWIVTFPRESGRPCCLLGAPDDLVAHLSAPYVPQTMLSPMSCLLQRMGLPVQTMEFIGPSFLTPTNTLAGTEIQDAGRPDTGKRLQSAGAGRRGMADKG